MAPTSPLKATTSPTPHHDAVSSAAPNTPIRLTPAGPQPLTQARAPAGHAAHETLPAAWPEPAAALLPMWRMPFAVALLDDDFRLLAANASLRQVLGASVAARALGQPFSLLLPPSDRVEHEAERGIASAAAARGAEAGPAPALPIRLLDAAGRHRWTTLALQPMAGDAAVPDARWLALMQDLSVESQARDLLRRGQHELDQWFDLAGAGMLVYDDDGLIVRSNAAFEALVERVPEVLQDAAPELAHLLGWDHGHVHGQLVVGAPVLERQALVPLPGGGRRRLVARLARGAAPSGGVLGEPPEHKAAQNDTAQGAGHVMAVVEDRSAEDERDLAQFEMGMLMSTASIGVATYDPVRGWLDSRSASVTTAAPAAQPVTPSAAEAHVAAGAAAAAVAPRSSLHHIGRDVVEPESLADYERLQAALRKGQRIEVRYAVRQPALGLRWLLTRVEPGVLAAGRTSTSVVTLDITEQELAQRRNAQLLREMTTILDSSTAGMAYLRGPALVRCNRRFERLLGFEPGAAAGASLGEILARQGVAAGAVAEALATLATARRYDLELQLPEPGEAESGSAAAPTRWVAFSVRRADSGSSGGSDSGAEFEAVAVLTDITRLKAQQAELESALSDRDLVFNLSDVGMVVQRGARFARANLAMAALTGYAVPELSTLDPAELYENTRACVEFEARVANALRQSGRFAGERQLRRRNGSMRWVQVAVRVIETQGGLAGESTICSFVDVDERHRAREALAAQAERTRAVLNSVLVGIVTVGEDGIEWMNRSARRMFGGELADFIGEPISTVATPEPDHPLRRGDWWQRAHEGRIDTFECRLRGRDGREFWVVGNAVVSTHEAGAAQLTFALLDIERRRQAEVSIARTQASLQRLIETAPMAIALFDARRGRLLQINRTAATLLGIDDGGAGNERAVLALPNMPNRALGEALSGWILALTPGETAVHEWRGSLPAEAGRAMPGPAEAGPLRVWDCRLASLGPTWDTPGDEAGEMPGDERGDERGEGPVAAADASRSPPTRAGQVMLLASDVTEARAADEARLREAVAQREVLVREVHHRIKNNLQGVAGLLKQNADRRPEVAGVLIEAVSQVQAIAQVYGLQVGGAGTAGAHGGPLPVVRLVGSIAQSVQRTFGRAIEVLPSAAGHLLPEAEAIPLALVLNELFTNAVRHGDGGAVRCVVVDEGAAVQIRIVGAAHLPAGFELERVPAGVSGLGLARALLPRRGARLSLAADGPEVVAALRLQPPSVRPAPTHDEASGQATGGSLATGGNAGAAAGASAGAPEALATDRG